MRSPLPERPSSLCRLSPPSNVLQNEARQVAGDKLTDLDKTVLDNEKRLEDWVAADPSILGMDLLLIGRQVITSYRGHIDLLAIDSDANLVILELKRDKTPRDIVAQTLDYATWVKDLSYQQADTIATAYRGKSLADLFAEHFGFAIPQTINVSHSMIILASELDDSSERIVKYLNEEHEVNINAIFFTFFGTKSGEFLGRAWLTDPQEVQERAAPGRKQAPWSGYYFVNVGEGECRNWDDCRKYGFLSAGQGRAYSRGMQKLKVDDAVFAYMKGLGYVGFGHVNAPAVMARDFVVEGDGEKLLKHPLKQPNMKQNSGDPELSEYVVGVKWDKTFPRDGAKWFPGGFANQNIVCKLLHEATVEFVEKEFEVEK